MIKYPVQTFEDSAELLGRALSSHDLAAVSRALLPLNVSETLEQLERLSTIERAVAYRTLPKGRAIEVFEGSTPPCRQTWCRGCRKPTLPRFSRS